MIRKSSKYFKIIGMMIMLLLLTGIILILVTRGQIVSMAASGLDRSIFQSKVAAADRNNGSNAINNEAAVGGSILLAAGDIARCQPAGGAATHAEEIWRNLDHSLGLPVAKLKANPGALQTANLVEQYPGAPVLALGDLAYPDGAPADFTHCYERIWGDFKQRTYPAPGNHEYHSLNAYGYYDYWGSRAGPERRGYYARRQNDWLILSLNSEVAADTDSLQARWLEDQLAKSDAACVLAFFHRPAFSTKDREGNADARRLFDILYRHGATLVLNGHNHFYERTRPLDAAGRVDPEHGIRTFVVGTGGTDPDDSRPPAAFSKRLIGGVHGLLKLELSPEEYQWQFLSAKTHEVLDSGAGSCNSR
ncbi:alkaline phosphatase [Pistricoccus aurantiacus]|uniref:Alkaline phosphatase n=1 Tax=Pistricoccus aurantiacus TaxID=1883414 RepID=A0A5B8SXH9_9GAMM|nr:metallophosphoesterase [Pistricoccus aurantiacus]QEA39500.1 alkaline phosphatase [Pistricoccus aurantiacus]